jgi:hypothetical protein
MNGHKSNGLLGQVIRRFHNICTLSYTGNSLTKIVVLPLFFMVFSAGKQP